MLNINPYNLGGVIRQATVNSCSGGTVPISLSAVPQEALTIYTLPLWGNMLHLLSQFASNMKTDVKGVGNRDIALH